MIFYCCLTLKLIIGIYVAQTVIVEDLKFNCHQGEATSDLLVKKELLEGLKED